MTDYILWMLLGWIGFCPWFLFFLHITCSCIIMHCTFFFLLSYALKFLLWLCFFLSYLSLSFSLLVMAPKKVVPSKSLICRGSSSSSFPLILFGFVMKRHIMTSLRNFFNWAIHSECQVILSYFPNSPLPGAISSQGWASLCKKPSRCPDVFIQEFYSNMHAIDTSVPSFSWYMYCSHPRLNFQDATSA